MDFHVHILLVCSPGCEWPEGECGGRAQLPEAAAGAAEISQGGAAVLRTSAGGGGQLHQGRQEDSQGKRREREGGSVGGAEITDICMLLNFCCS